MLFLKTLDKKNVFFWSKRVFFGKKLTIKWYILHIILSQICTFAFVAKIATWDEMSQKCQIFGPKWPKMHIFDQIWSFLGQKILIHTRGSKSLDTHVTEKPPRQLVRIVFRSGIGSNGPKMPIFGQKCHFWAKSGRFLAENSFFGGGIQ